MKLIVGLGNPGSEYQMTRHNVGFVVLDQLASKWGLEWRDSKKFKGEIAEKQGLLLLKPSTFMNASGKSVREVSGFYKIKGEELWVVHDDLDIGLGEYKIQMGKGPKVHGGVMSIEEELGSGEFWRVRVGVENRESRKIRGEEYVLDRFRDEEKKKIEEVVEKIVEELKVRINEVVI